MRREPPHITLLLNVFLVVFAVAVAVVALQVVLMANG